MHRRLLPKHPVQKCMLKTWNSLVLAKRQISGAPMLLMLGFLTIVRMEVVPRKIQT